MTSPVTQASTTQRRNIFCGSECNVTLVTSQYDLVAYHYFLSGYIVGYRKLLSRWATTQKTSYAEIWTINMWLLCHRVIKLINQFSHVGFQSMHGYKSMRILIQRRGKGNGTAMRHLNTVIPYINHSDRAGRNTQKQIIWKDQGMFLNSVPDTAGRNLLDSVLFYGGVGRSLTIMVWLYHMDT